MARLSYNQGPAAGETKKRSLLAANPIMRRLDKVDEYGAQECATYNGIIMKTALFMLFTLGGVILNLVLTKSLSVGEMMNFSIKNFPVSVYMNEIFAVGACLVLAIVFQLLAFFVKASTPVTGALYCVTQGYIIAFLLFRVAQGYEYLGALALAITFVIVITMSLLYKKGIVRVNKKFKAVLFTLMITGVTISLLTFLAYLIPFTRNIAALVVDHTALSIFSSVIFIIIASLFLISDFDTIDNVVNNKLPKKYEWMAAFGLAFTIIWIYVKVLDILLRVIGNKKN